MNKVKFLTWAHTVPSTPFYPAEGRGRGGWLLLWVGGCRQSLNVPNASLVYTIRPCIQLIKHVIFMQRFVVFPIFMDVTVGLTPCESIFTT